MLEPDEGKLSRPVLRAGGRSNPASLTRRQEKRPAMDLARGLSSAKWADDGSLWQAFLARVRHLAAEKQLDISVLQDRKSTRLNSSHSQISYAVFCLKKKKKKKKI